MDYLAPKAILFSIWKIPSLIVAAVLGILYRYIRIPFRKCYDSQKWQDSSVLKLLKRSST